MNFAESILSLDKTPFQMRAYANVNAVSKRYCTEQTTTEYRFQDGSGLRFGINGIPVECETMKYQAPEFV